MEWTPEVIKMIITLVVTNSILLVMVGVWAYLSIKNGSAQDISLKFIALGAVLCGPDVVQALISIKDMVIPVVQNVVR